MIHHNSNRCENITNLYWIPALKNRRSGSGLLNPASEACLVLAAPEWIKFQKVYIKSSIKDLSSYHVPELITVQCADYADALAEHPNAFVFADPPYYGLSAPVYTDESMDHSVFADLMRDRDFVITYRDHPYIRSLYDWCDVLDMPCYTKMQSVSGNLLVTDIIIKKG